MARWTKAIVGSKHSRANDEARERFAQRRLEDPGAWAYMSCVQDEDTCELCLHAAGLLRHVKLSDPRLMVMLRGHPDCTSPHGCRCKIEIVPGDGSEVGDDAGDPAAGDTSA